MPPLINLADTITNYLSYITYLEYSINKTLSTGFSENKENLVKFEEVINNISNKVDIINKNAMYTAWSYELFILFMLFMLFSNTIIMLIIADTYIQTADIYRRVAKEILTIQDASLYVKLKNKFIKNIDKVPDYSKYIAAR